MNARYRLSRLREVLMMAGTLGLALSGGGFRAALFHLGVMAQLARRGLLPDVRVISTVSGGSIIGAYYVLALERELRGRPSGLEREDYVELVRTLSAEFLEVAQWNLRLRTFANLASNVKMIRSSYSRSDRMGEILDRQFFCRALTGKAGARGEKIEMRVLGDLEAERGHALPHLIINATNLNTGHSWRFEGQTMGEWSPRSGEEWDLDRSAVYARAGAYGWMIEAKGGISLGKAVAASAAVPGLFHLSPSRSSTRTSSSWSTAVSSITKAWTLCWMPAAPR